MKFPAIICLAIMLGSAPLAALAQAPAQKTEGLTAAEKLNQQILDANAAAAAREAADLAAYQAQQAATDQANREALAKYNAQIKQTDAETRAAAEETARLNAQVDAKTAAINAQTAAAAADFAAKNQAYQAQLAASQAAQAAYQRDLADYNACLAGQKSRCKPQ